MKNAGRTAVSFGTSRLPFFRRRSTGVKSFPLFGKILKKALDKPRAVCYNKRALSQGRSDCFPRDHDKNGLVAQLVRALACHARGRGFEPHPSRHSCTSADLAHLVERDLAKVEVAGSSPVIRSIWRHSQAVRQRSAKPSSPVRFRVAPPKRKAPCGVLFSLETPSTNRPRSARGARRIHLAPPPEDRQARLSGAGRADIRHRRNYEVARTLKRGCVRSKICF